MAFIIQKNTIERPAPTGRVITQEITIFRTTPKLIAAIPRAIPTPKTAPTNV